MISHAPADYTCPFCYWLTGHETEHNQQSDIVWQDEHTTAFISPRWWRNNPGHVVVIPNKHYENIYDTPQDVFVTTYVTAQKMATAIRNTYNCDGISTRQHNEPAGNQDVWHLHVHVYPRYDADKLYQNHDDKRFASSQERQPYADMLKEYFATN